jgi:hypothetical protein
MDEPSMIAPWPWRSSSAAGLVTLGLMALLYAGEPVRGIALASATNMAAVVFFLVGGIGTASGACAASSWSRFAAASVAGAVIAAVLCWATVVLLRVLILSDEPFRETVLEDGFGRALVVFEGSALVGIVSGALRRLARRRSAGGAA